MAVKYAQTPLRKRSAHEIADAAELGILFCLYERVSRATVHSILGEEPGILLDVGDGASGYEEVGKIIAPPGSSSAEKKEKGDLVVSDVLRQFAFRASVFGHAYPFKFKNGILELKGKIRSPHSLYIFLLICSSLGAFKKNKGLLQAYAALFEEVCVDAMRGFFNESAVVKRFGAGSRDRQEHFGMAFSTALKVLANDIRTTLVGTREHEAGKHGDGGLDVVGSTRFPESDAGDSTLVVFGQCATGEDWPSKIYESSATNWRRWLDFRHEPSNAIFIPRCYRDSNGEWHDSDGRGAIIVDRVRILHLTKNRPREEVITLLADNRKFGLPIQVAA